MPKYWMSCGVYLIGLGPFDHLPRWQGYDGASNRFVQQVRAQRNDVLEVGAGR